MLFSCQQNVKVMVYTILVLTILVIKAGYVRSDTNQTCGDCSNGNNILSCDPGKCHWLLKNGFWAGNISVGGPLVVAYCPVGFCLVNVSSEYVWIPHSKTDEMSEILCNASHRTGVLCNECRYGFAPAINPDSFDCVPCSAESSKVNWIYYILSVYVPLFVVFLIIIVFNIRLTTGPVNAFILYAQVVSTTLNINASGVAPLNLVFGSADAAFQSIYTVPYDLFNLNLFGNILPPFCLSTDLNTLDTIALKYVEAFFPVLMIIAITLLVRCQRFVKCSVNTRCCRQKHRLATSLVQAFAAFVLLSYNRLCELTVYLIVPVPVWDYTLHTVQNRIYYKGNLLLNDPNYPLRYKVAAYSVLTLLILLPITLLHYPTIWLERVVSKVRCLKKVYPAASIAILLDTFQGCFKDNRRYFAGLYLGLRLLLFFSFYQAPLLQLLLQQVLITVYSFLLAYLRPYKNMYLNYLDISIFANMALINSLTWYISNQTEPDDVPLVTSIIFESILVFLPMAYLIAYLLWYSTQRCHERIKMKCILMYRGLKNVSGGRFHAKDSAETAEPVIHDLSTYYSLLERAEEDDQLHG